MILDVKNLSDSVEKKSDVEIDSILYLKTYKDGLTISARLKYKHYVWVENFLAVHPVFGKIKGDLNSK